MSDPASTGKPESAEIQPVDAQSKLELECAKLIREQKLLDRQLKPSWLALEWLKGLTVPVAVLGVVVTGWIGLQQIQVANENRQNERYEKALARAGSVNARERNSGIASLVMFTREESPERRRQAFRDLVQLVSHESDEALQASIVEPFHRIGKRAADQALALELLEAAAARSRALHRTLMDTWPARQHAARMTAYEALVARAGARGRQRDGDGFSMDERLTVVAHHPFLLGPNEVQERVTLNGFAKLIALLSRKVKAPIGSDFSEIYCEGCDFSKLDFSGPGTNFSGSSLADAKFNHANLSKVDFTDADLSSASMFGANLRGARLERKKAHLPVDAR